MNLWISEFVLREFMDDRVRDVSNKRCQKGDSSSTTIGRGGIDTFRFLEIGPGWDMLEKMDGDDPKAVTNRP
jgi:hypothetical protein